jgi:predicted RNase H-like nuclease
MKHVGVDGCAAGWIAVSTVQGELIYRIFCTVAELVTAFGSAELILIDIPIGLPWRDAPVRPCDHLARARLGQRRSSVFPVACRPAVHADAVSSARTHNQGVLGRSLSQQSWAICRKIAEVDDLLRSRGVPVGAGRKLTIYRGRFRLKTDQGV